jgi:hypothetical protein
MKYVIKTPQELASKLAEAYRGNYLARAQLKEALSTSDLPELFRVVTQFGVMAQYEQIQPQWREFSTPWQVSDFRPNRFMRWESDMSQMVNSNGGFERHSLALPRIPELTEYPTFSLEAEEELFGINKYGGRYAFSFEALLNDEYNIIQALPGEMASSARDTEDVLTTGVLATEDGPNPAFFNTSWDFGPRAPQGNIFPDNPPLTMDSLQEGVNIVAQRTTGNGTRPVRISRFVLVVPPSLELTANTILAQANIVRRTPDGSGGELETTIANPLRGRVRVVVNEWLPILDTSANSGTTWYLLPDGAAAAGNRRPAVITTFMTGREAPELRISGDTGRYIGGGDVAGTEGSFLNDDVQYRVRHITGAAGVDPTGTLVSDGSGEPSGS